MAALAVTAVALKKTDRLLQHVAVWPLAWQTSLEVRLATALRFLAGGQILDLRMSHHVVKSGFYLSVWCGCAALQAEFPMRDTDKLRVLEAEFRAKSVGGVWTVDGGSF